VLVLPPTPTPWKGEGAKPTTDVVGPSRRVAVRRNDLIASSSDQLIVVGIGIGIGMVYGRE